MGQTYSSSKTTSEVLTELSTQIANKSVQQCFGSASNNQNVSFVAGGDITIRDMTIKQVSSINISCVMSNGSQAKIANDVANAIVQEAQSKAGLFTIFGTSSFSEAVSAVSTKIMNRVDISSMQTQMVGIIQNQSFSANAGANILVANMSVEQVSTIVAKFIISNSAYTDIINEVSAKIDQSAKSDAGTLDIFGKYWIFILIIIIALFGIGAILLLGDD